jgi:hypothetical protein
MRELHDPRAEVFLDALEAALGGPGRRSREVLSEVRSDLEAAVSHAMNQGQDARSAWAACLEELGDPEELAAAMRGPLAPEAPPTWVANARRLVAILLAGLAASIAWQVRSWDYGNRFGLFSMVACLHLPFVLLLWPGIVWRHNALFRTSTTLVIIGLAWFVAFGVSRTEIDYDMPVVELGAIVESGGAQSGATESGAAQAPVQALEAPEPPLVDKETLAALLALAFVVLVLSLVQQGKQRRRILLVTAGLLLAVDLPHTIEELLFVREARSAAAWIAAEQERTGLLPTEERFASGYEPLLIDDLWYSRREATFSLQWSRATRSSSELGYRSDGKIWGND